MFIALPIPMYIGRRLAPLRAVVKFLNFTSSCYSHLFPALLLKEKGEFSATHCISTLKNYTHLFTNYSPLTRRRVSSVKLTAFQL